jgi:hypothetical protein
LLDILAEFCDANGLVVNVRKTKAMLFGPGVEGSPMLYKGEAIEWVSEFKYLGLTFDRKASSKTMCKRMLQKAKSVFGWLTSYCKHNLW